MYKGSCEYCIYCVYDEEYGEEVCEAEMDMDETEVFFRGSYRDCPFFRINNEYKIVEKQN